MNSARRAAAVAAAVLAVLAAVGPFAVATASASTPPTPVCPVCSYAGEAAADDAGVPFNETRSDVVVTVDDAGDARFTAHVDVNQSTADALRGNQSAVDALVDEAFEYRYLGDDRGARNVTGRFDGTELVVSWTIPDAAHDGPGGTLLVTLFGESRHGVELHADQLSLYGPEGWNVSNHPKTGDVESLATPGNDRTGERVVWDGDADHESRAHLDEGTYVAFAETDGLGARVNAELAIAFAIGPEMLSDALVAGAPSALVLAAALAACLFVLGGSPNPGRDARWFAIAGALLTVAGFVFAIVDGYGPLTDRNLELLALPASLAAFGWLTARAPAVANLREAAMRVAATIGIGGVVTVTFANSYLSLMAATTAVAVGGFYLVGVYDQRVGWPVAAVTALVLIAPIVGVLPTTPIGGFGPGFVSILLLPMTVVSAVVGVAAYRVGAGKEVTGERVVERPAST